MSQSPAPALGADSPLGTDQGADTGQEALVGRAVKLVREQKGFSTRALAAAAGISQAFLSQVERGLSAPSVSTLYKLAGALEVEPGVLLPSTKAADVRVVRAEGGMHMPVADRADAARARIIELADADVTGLMEYCVETDQYVEEWFLTKGPTGVYVLEGDLIVDFVARESIELHPGDYLALPADVRERWRLAGETAVRLLCITGAATQTS